TVEIRIGSFVVTYKIGHYEERTKLVQPAPVTVDPLPFAFKADRSLDISKIGRRLTIRGGDGFETSGDTVIFHYQAAPAGTDQLTEHTLPRLVEAGEDQNGNILYAQDTDATSGEPLSDTFLSLEGVGLGIDRVHGQLGLDGNRYFGVEMQG